MTPQEEIDSLKKTILEKDSQLAEKDKTLTEQAKQINTLTAKQADQAKQIGEQNKKIAELSADNLLKEEGLAEAASVVSELKLQLAEKTEALPKRQILTIAKRQYELLSNFTWKGKEVTFAVLKANTNLAAELVAEKVGFLQLVESAA